MRWRLACIAEDPYERLRALEDALAAYRSLRREYELLPPTPDHREARRALEPPLRAAREHLFTLLDPHDKQSSPDQEPSQ